MALDFQLVLVVCDKDPSAEPPLRLPCSYDLGQPEHRPGRFPLWLRDCVSQFSSQVLLRQKPGMPSPNNSFHASVTELGITENEFRTKFAVLLPEPTNTEHLIRWKGFQKIVDETVWAFYFTEICKKSKSSVFIHYEKVSKRSSIKLFTIAASCQ